MLTASTITINVKARTKYSHPMRRELPAYTDESFPGLAVHREFEGKQWAITHIATGMGATRGLTYATRAEAVEVAIKMAAILDWTQSADELRKCSLESLDKLRAIWYGLQ
jgi:hypothetical protein